LFLKYKNTRDYFQFSSRVPVLSGVSISWLSWLFAGIVSEFHGGSGFQGAEVVAQLESIMNDSNTKSMLRIIFFIKINFKV
jgi:hypothetical protein